MSRLQNKSESEIPLVLENLFFHQETPIPEDGKHSAEISTVGVPKEVWEAKPFPKKHFSLT